MLEHELHRRFQSRGLLPLNSYLFKCERNGCRLARQHFFFAKLNLPEHRLRHRPGHQSIDAYLWILESVRLAEKDFQQSRHAALTKDGQDQQGFRSALPADRCFYPYICLGILDAQNLERNLAARRDTQYSWEALPHIRSSTSAPGSVNQLAVF